MCVCIYICIYIYIYIHTHIIYTYIYLYNIYIIYNIYNIHNIYIYIRHLTLHVLGLAPVAEETFGEVLFEVLFKHVLLLEEAEHLQGAL